MRAYFSDEERSLYTDNSHFWKANGQEIVETFAIADSVQIPTSELGACLVRFSLGGDMYRTQIWMRKVDECWYPCWSQYFSTHSDEFDDLSEENKEVLDEMFERIKSWREDTPQVWWKWWHS